MWVGALLVACGGGSDADGTDATGSEGTTAGTSGGTSVDDTAGSGPSGGTSAGSDDGSGDSDDSSGGPQVPAECNDGIDNDGDGYTDWQSDFGCYGPGDQTEAALARADEDGFTTFELPDDGLVIYVSNDGDDGADGLTPETAVATLTHAADLVRDGEHDFILLRRGDVWRDEGLARFKSGRDATHPLVIGGYGDSMTLPRIEVAGHFIDHNGQARSHVALIGLHLVSYPGMPGDPGFDGEPEALLRYVGGGTNLLVEGCHFQYGEIVVQSIDDATVYEDVEVRRNVVERAYHRDTCTPGDPNGNSAFRPSGLYSSHVHRLTIEDNVFDHNGWNPEDEPTACATIYNHNLYVNGTDMVVRGNLLARASSIHIKFRSDTSGDMQGLLVEDNFFIEGEIGISLGGNSDEAYRFVDGELRDNVFTDIGRSQPTGRTLAWGIDIIDNDGLAIVDNLVLNNRAPGVNNAYGLSISGGTGRDYQIDGNLFWRLQNRAIRISGDPGHDAVSVTGNTIVDPELGGKLVDFSGSFGAYAFGDNAYHSSAAVDAWFSVPGMGNVSLADWTAASGEAGATSIEVPSFTDPERDAESYAAAIGEGSTLQDLLDAALGQTRLTWREDLTAGAINDWIRAGFDR